MFDYKNFFHKKVQLLLKQIICLTIVSELLLVGLGFCGHSHEHHDEEKSIPSCYPQLNENHSDNHNFPHSHKQSDTRNSNKKDSTEFHCTCLGGINCIVTVFAFYSALPFKYFHNNELNSYKFAWLPSVFRPPHFIH